MARYWLTLACLLMAAFLAPSTTAQPQPARIALLIGNQAYDRSVGALKNPHNDITLVGEALKKQGFQVLPLVKDASRVEILGGVREFVKRLNTAGSGAVGFIYYSGHGAAEKDTNVNYIIPVDARQPGSSAFWDQSLKLDDILKLLDGARSAAKFIVFDACRNELQLPTKDTSKGLVPVSEQQGMFIAYASAPGRTASDLGDKSGPYAAALAAELATPGLDHLNFFQNVKEKVLASTGGSQQPWESNGLGRRVYLTSAAAALAVNQSTPAPKASDTGAAEVVRICREVEAMTSLSMLGVLERQHAGAPAADCISARIGELKAAQTASAAKPAEKTAPTPPVASLQSADAAQASARLADARNRYERIAKLHEQKVVSTAEFERARNDLSAAEAASKAAASTTSNTSPSGASPDPASMAPGTVFRDCNDGCPEMVVVPAGTFMMGEGSSQRRTSIAQSFAGGKFEVTFAEWEACVAGGGCTSNKSPSDQGWGKGRRPVINVSWDDAKEYVSWISRKTGKTYRLLTEAEWEYAARAGSSTTYSWGDAIGRGNANCDGCGSQWDNKQTAPVGSFKPNGFGLHDMHGNVWEWCEDAYSSSFRVRRGGSWGNDPSILRSAGRYGLQPGLSFSVIGFRLARTLLPP